MLYVIKDTESGRYEQRGLGHEFGDDINKSVLYTDELKASIGLRQCKAYFAAATYKKDDDPNPENLVFKKVSISEINE
jgi:hypothetical protein